MTGAALVEMNEARGKIEMDQSYQERNRTKESGIFSNESETSRENITADSSWDFWENEIADPKSFNPPFLQSTNLLDNKEAITCSFSSIDESGVSSKGKINLYTCTKYEMPRYLHVDQNQ